MSRLLASLLILMASAHAAEDQRPEGLNGATWQFGPLNRWAYTHMSEVLPSKPIRSNPLAIRALEGDGSAPFEVDLDGERTAIEAAMAAQYADGLLVLKDGRIVVERYAGTHAPDRTHLLWSVSKTITSLVAASVIADGLVDPDATVGSYVPELADSGWGPAPVRALLDMRDGSNWTEDYSAPDSTVRRQDCADGLLAGADCADQPVIGNYRFLPDVGRDDARAGTFVYKSGTTDVIAWVLEAATGKRFADLVSERIWQPIGAERDAGITVDVGGFTLASGGMHATLRDLGRVGQLMLERGRVGGARVLPEAWFDDLFSRAGDPDWQDWAAEGASPYYRSFVWGLGDGRGTVQARGVHGQIIQVSPASDVVVVLQSSWPDAEGGAEGVGEVPVQALLAAIERAVR